jgi:hypothetical protein
MIYGYINEFGNLTSRDFKEAEIASLDAVWKPVEPIQEEKLSAEYGYHIKLEPYDDGDKIRYRYVKKVDKQAFLIRIQNLQSQLEDTDYQVIKCYEASLSGKELPYDIQELTSTRQAMRDEINQLQVQFANA